ncbi:MAG: 3-hydroxyacyl-CoA dehydrogenase NAD-binding domain-containing protein [Planctomycetia bacterium]|nr:3-hydroxyacyl-CoA dehydrogenase NAD-binding domain-containing protein [Planctomycetia bacterium]
MRRLIERNRRALRAAVDSLGPERPASLGIVGAGMMGTAIAAAAIGHGLPVVLTDCDAEVLANAPLAVAAELGDDAASLVERLVRTTADLPDVACCDVVLESVAENVPVKQAVYADVEPHLGERTILGTNTSTIPIARLAVGLTSPGRFCGIHFFHPVRERPLVEIVRGPETDERTLAAGMALADALGKMAVVVEDGPGFLVNRLLLPYLSEAMELLLDGVPIQRVEAVATAFGMAKGPLRLMDEIGLDTALAGGRVLWEAFGDRVVVSPLVIAMYKAKRFGSKAGAGFFRYSGTPEGEATSVDPFALEKIRDWARPAKTLGDEEILARLLLPMVLEATRLIEEGKVADPRDVDLGVLFGLGFPPARGGLLYWADTLGASEIVEMLRPLESLGPRAEPTPMLLEMAASGAKWYG